jgi:hypothetical protein
MVTGSCSTMPQLLCQLEGAGPGLLLPAPDQLAGLLPGPRVRAEAACLRTGPREGR